MNEFTLSGIFSPAFAICAALLAAAIAILFVSAGIRRRVGTMERLLARQSGLLLKMRENFRARAASDTVAQNAEIIFQDLLQHVSPIVRAMEIAPRETEEHLLWRTLGGLADEYARNPYVLENLRRLIKLDGDVSRCADAFLVRAEKLLRYLAAGDPDGLLASTFAEGLLGQTMTLLSQAKQLAQAS